MKKVNKDDIQLWFIKRKLKKQMLGILKDVYNVNIKSLSNEKVNGMGWKERLLSIYIIDMSNKDFTSFYRIVKPISRNLKAVESKWWEVLTTDGKAVNYGKM